MVKGMHNGVNLRSIIGFVGRGLSVMMTIKVAMG